MRNDTVVLAGLALCLSACIATEPAAPDRAQGSLSPEQCDARARDELDACLARCTARTTGETVSACQRQSDRGLAAKAEVLVGMGVIARNQIVVPFELCSGEAIVSSCGEDQERARDVLASYGTGGRALVDAWYAAGQGLDCATAKWVRRAECIRERRTWVQLQAVNGTDAQREAARTLWTAIGVYDVQAQAWMRDRRDCAGDQEACVDDCAPGRMDRLSCRWECPVTVGGACTPFGLDRACGEVDRSFAWDSLYACECSADTAACRAPAN